MTVIKTQDFTRYKPEFCQTLTGCLRAARVPI